MTLTVRASSKPGYVIMPRALIFEYAQRAIRWKRQQLADEGHPLAATLRAFEPIPECELIDGWVEPVVLGIWETDDFWVCRIHVESGRVQLRRRI